MKKSPEMFTKDRGGQVMGQPHVLENIVQRCILYASPAVIASAHGSVSTMP